MRLTLVFQSLSQSETIDIDENTDLETFKIVAATYADLEPSDIQVTKQGQVLNGDSDTTLFSLGTRDGDSIYISTKPSNTTPIIDFSTIDVSKMSNKPNVAEKKPCVIDFSNIDVSQLFNKPNGSGTGTPNLAQLANKGSAILKKPELTEEQIKQKHIDSQYYYAMEHNPESFALTTMLYINCKVNQQDTKAFVDSGAQTTFISLAFAKQSGIDQSIDTRFKGLAKGVGKQEILGQIHSLQLSINNVFLQLSVKVLENMEMDMLIGLDMLKRFQCSINLRRCVLEIGSVGIETPFLVENEMPDYAKLSGKTEKE